MSETAARLWTYQEALAQPADRLSEIASGEWRELPPPANNHVVFKEELAEMPHASLDRRELRVLTSTFGQDLRRAPLLTYRNPDLDIYPTRDVSVGRLIWSVPELLVECLSPANRKGDVDELIAGYADARVPEVWLTYPEQGQIVRRHPVGRSSEVIEHGTITPHRSPSLTVDLAPLWQAYRGVM